MTPPTRRLKTGRVRQTRLEIARYLMLRYAPEAELKIVPGGADRLMFDGDGKSNPTIVFDPRECLTVLLHEIGHWATMRKAEKATWALEEEAFAWEWAEQAARRENLWFDYTKADRYFASHAAANKTASQAFDIPVRIAWRWKA